MNTNHETWIHEKTLWHSGPSFFGQLSKESYSEENLMDCSSSITNNNNNLQENHTLLDARSEMMYNLLLMLQACDKEDMSRTLLTMSSTPDSCVSLRQSGSIPLLIELIHGNQTNEPFTDISETVRYHSSHALHNIVFSHISDRRGKREARVLRLLEQFRAYSEHLQKHRQSKDKDEQQHPIEESAVIMKLSFDEGHRQAMCELGTLQAIVELIQMDHLCHSQDNPREECLALRRYACMALTNLTFGDSVNKTLLCSFSSFMQILMSQLNCSNEDLRQVAASVLRNLSWRADHTSKKVLQEIGVIKSLMRAAMEAKKESTLKATLSALWNLSAHCSSNKAEICSVDKALSFLVKLLSYDSDCNTLTIIENAGGILRNISSHIAIREDYSILLKHLQSPSLTVVSNACGTLWNLSARSHKDQLSLWELGAVPMLRSLINSKHKMICMGSTAALKNLLAAFPHEENNEASSFRNLSGHNRKPSALQVPENAKESCEDINACSCKCDLNPENVGSTETLHKEYSGSQPVQCNTHSCQLEASNKEYESEKRLEISSDKIYENNIDLLENHCHIDCSADKASTNVLLSFAHQHDIPVKPFDSQAMAVKISQLHNSYLKSGVLTQINERNWEAQSLGKQGSAPPADGNESAKLSPFSTPINKYKVITMKQLVPSLNLISEKDELVYSTFSETDLDNPDHVVDYSQIYHEIPDEQSKNSFPLINAPPTIHSVVTEDTVKTYFTEGTPHGYTPCNFSVTASLQDLTLSDPNETSLDNQPTIVESAECTWVDTTNKINKKELRVSINETKPEGDFDSHGEETSVQDTPLMFSRCSSLGSLSSFEQQSIHDDHGTIQSDIR